MPPRNDWSSARFFGSGILSIADFLEPFEIPSLDSVCPKYSTVGCANVHFFMYSWDNVPCDLDNGMQSNELRFIKNGAKQKFLLNPGHYDNADHILAGITEALKTNQNCDVWFNYDSIRRRVQINLPSESKMVLSKHLAYMLGFNNTVLSNQINTAEYPPDLRGGIDSLFVYSDIVQPQIVGDSMQPLLRTVPVGGSYGDILHRVFVSPHYVDVLHRDFSSIAISIKTDRDLPVPFKFGKTFVKLHFRRK